MSTQQQHKATIFFQIKNCKVKFSPASQSLNCTLILYQNKSIQFQVTNKNYQKQKLEQTQELNNFHTNIYIDLNYGIQIIQITKQDRSNKNNQFLHNFVLTDFKNDNKIYVLIEKLQKQKQILKQYFKGYAWMCQSIDKQFENVKQILSNQNNNNISKFILLRDNLTFQNQFVKKYQKKHFIDKNTAKLVIQPIIREIYFQNMVRHKNIMRFSYFIADKQSFYLFYCQKPCKILSHHISHCGQLSSTRIRKIIQQILKVIQEFQSVQIIHNNIRSSSVFIIENNKKWKVCLGEFQLTHFINEDYILPIKQKQKYYFAPQLIKGNPFYEKFHEYSDLFSLGVLFYQLLFRKPLYDNKTIQKRIQNQPINFEAKQFRVISNRCVDLFRQVIQFDPNYRISPSQALEHHYFTQTQNFNPGQIYFFQSFQTSASMNSFDTLVDVAYNKKIQQQKNRDRERFYATNIPKKSFLNSQCGKFLLTCGPNFHESNGQNVGTIHQTQMDDTHKSLLPRDIRIMKPSYTRNRFC